MLFCARHAARSQTHPIKCANSACHLLTSCNTSIFAWLLVPLCAKHAARSQTHQVLLGFLCLCVLGMPPAHKHIKLYLAWLLTETIAHAHDKESTLPADVVCSTLHRTTTSQSFKMLNRHMSKLLGGCRHRLGQASKTFNPIFSTDRSDRSSFATKVWLGFPACRRLFFLRFLRTGE